MTYLALPAPVSALRRCSLAVSVCALAFGCGSSQHGSNNSGIDDDAPMCTSDPRPPPSAPKYEQGKMTPPRLVHFRPPHLAGEEDPRVAGQEPRSAFRCVLTAQGRLEQCCVLEETSRAVSKSYLWVMPDWRYEPAKMYGEAVSIQYTVKTHILTGPTLGKTVRAQPPGGTDAPKPPVGP